MRCANFFAQVLALMAALFFGAGKSHDSSVSTKIDHVSYGDLLEVRDVQIVDNDFGAHRHDSRRRRLPMGRELTFTAVGAEFDFKVDLHLELTAVFGEKAKVYGALADGVEPHDRSYRGGGVMEKCGKDGECAFYGDVEKASVTFFESFGEHVFHALVRLETEEFAVDPKRLVEKDRFKNGDAKISRDSRLTSLEPDMYFYSSSDIFEKTADETSGDVMFMPKRRLLQQLEVYTNCYSGQNQAIYRISMGMLIDNGFYAVTGGNSQSVRDYVASMFNDMNTMYNKQMGVEIALNDLVLGDTTGFTGSTFNEGPSQPGWKTCPSGKGPGNRLNEFRDWRQTYHSNNMGIWHLMTHCHPAPGTIGIAYVGALCESYGVGVTSYTGRTTWETLAHEVGHNFGSGHTFDRGPGVSGGIMDYGDGLLNGIYQFHPVHRNEVCAEISGSMTRQRDIDACWSTGDPTPVVQPTPRPVAQPIPTPRPTVAPLGDAYQWYSTGTYGSCSVSCGNGFRSEEVQCRRYDLSTCSIPGGTDTTTCSSYNFASRGCQYTTVTSAMCSIGCRPPPNTVGCSGGSCGTQCGNGVLDKEEYCDTALEACCDACSSWKTSTQCQGTNPVVDAAVMDYDQRLYLFQGNTFTVYDDMDDSSPLDGYPKPLSVIEGLDSAFQGGIDSAASFYDDYVLLFKDLKYVLIDLGELAQLGSVRDVHDYFTLNQDFLNCGRVDAILSYYWTLDLICDDITAEFSWKNDRVGPSELVTDRWSMGWPNTISPGQATAAVRNPISGKIRFYQGSYQSEWAEGSNTPVVRRSPPLGANSGPVCGWDVSGANIGWTGAETSKCENGITVEDCRDKCAAKLNDNPPCLGFVLFMPTAQFADGCCYQKYDAGANPVVLSGTPSPASVAGVWNCQGDPGSVCLVDNCETCASDLQTCTTCSPGYRRKKYGRLCKRRRNFVDLTFDDDNSYTAAFLQYTSGHETSSADNGGWALGGEIVADGAFGNGLRLNGNQRSQLQPHDFGGAVEHWKVSLWWKPETSSRQRMLTINRDRGTGVEQFTIDFVTESTTENIADGKFAIEVMMYDSRVDCMVDHPIAINEWNKVSIEFGKGYIVTASNGIAHKIGMETGDTDDYAVEFKDWYIGEDAAGISGTIDKFEVANLDIEDGAGAETGAKPLWFLALVGGGSALALTLVALIFYKCYVKPKWCAPALEEHLNATSGNNSPSSDHHHEYDEYDARPITGATIGGAPPKRRGGAIKNPRAAAVIRATGGAKKKKKTGPRRGLKSAPPPPPPKGRSPKYPRRDIGTRDERQGSYTWKI